MSVWRSACVYPSGRGALQGAFATVSSLSFATVSSLCPGPTLYLHAVSSRFFCCQECCWITLVCMCSLYTCTLCPADFSVAKNAAGSLLYACARYIPARCPPACETRVNEWRVEGRVIGARSCLKICTRSRLSCTSARRHAQLCGQDSQLVLSSSSGFLLSLCRLAVNCRDLLLVL